MLALALLLFAGSSTASADLADETALAEHFAPVLSVATDRGCTEGPPLSPDGHRHAARQQHRRAARAVERERPRQDRPQRGGARGQPLRLPPRLPRRRARSGLRLRALGAARDRGTRDRRLRARRPPGGRPATDRAAVLVLLRLQRLEQPARGRLGDDPAQLRRAERREALARTPASVGYSQHEGAERANWGDDKLELVDGTHPVLHPAAGSHAGFYTSALSSGHPDRRASAATTRASRRPASARTSRRSRATPPRPAARSRGSPSKATGASCSPRSSTGRPART